MRLNLTLERQIRVWSQTSMSFGHHALLLYSCVSYSICLKSFLQKTKNCFPVGLYGKQPMVKWKECRIERKTGRTSCADALIIRRQTPHGTLISTHPIDQPSCIGMGVLPTGLYRSRRPLNKRSPAQLAIKPGLIPVLTPLSLTFHGYK